MVDRSAPQFSFSAHRLDHRGCVRVGDFGLAEDMYCTGYVREESKTLKIPYKWMPPESLEDGLFSEMSDVVTLCLPSYTHNYRITQPLWFFVVR